LLCFGGALLWVVGEEEEASLLLGDDESRKKMKLGLFHSWKKILECLRIALEWASASEFKYVGLGLKPNRGI
jgi:hypothetical protein